MERKDTKQVYKAPTLLKKKQNNSILFDLAVVKASQVSFNPKFTRGANEMLISNSLRHRAKSTADSDDSLLLQHIFFMHSGSGHPSHFRPLVRDNNN